MGRKNLPRPTVGGRTHLGLAVQVPSHIGTLRQDAGQLPGPASISLCPHLVPSSTPPRDFAIVSKGDGGGASPVANWPGIWYTVVRIYSAMWHWMGVPISAAPYVERGIGACPQSCFGVCRFLRPAFLSDVLPVVAAYRRGIAILSFRKFTVILFQGPMNGLLAQGNRVLGASAGA